MAEKFVDNAFNSNLCQDIGSTNTLKAEIGIVRTVLCTLISCLAIVGSSSKSNSVLRNCLHNKLFRAGNLPKCET